MKEAIHRLASSRYQGFSTVIFYGSHANNKATLNSDVDLIVIFDAPISPYREKIRFEGHLFDVFVYDAESLNGAIHVARANSNFVLIESLLSSMPIPGPHPIYNAIIEAARRARRKVGSGRSLVNERQYITGLLDDIESEMCSSNLVMLFTDLYRAIVDLLLLIHGFGGFGKRQAARAISSRDPQLSAALERCFRAALDGDKSSFIELAMRILGTIGGPLREGFRTNLPDVLRIPLLDIAAE